MDQFSFPFQKILKAQLTAEARELVTAAEAAAEKAYAPYSRFKVGAAVQMEHGRIITGNNHENASFPAGVCAERAVLSGIDMHEKGEKVIALAVTYKGGGELSQPLAPCGLCRQTILEVQQWQQSPITLYLCSPDGQVIMVEDAGWLLPFSFSSDYLGHTS